MISDEFKAKKIGYQLDRNLLLTLSFGCHQNPKLLVQPINEEFNQKFLTGEGLNKNYFNTHDVMQYYQFSKYDGFSDNQILLQLESFARATFPSKKLDHLQNLTLLFYKKQMFIDYSDHLYASARDNENRRLEGYSHELLSTITFEWIKEDPKRMSFHRMLYDNNKLLVQGNG